MRLLVCQHPCQTFLFPLNYGDNHSHVPSTSGFSCFNYILRDSFLMKAMKDLD